MSKIVVDILRKIFSKEKAGLITWLKKRKSYLVATILVVGIVLVFIRWPKVYTIFLDNKYGWLTWILFVWLVILSLYTYRRDKVRNEREFKDNFRHGLEKWEYYGSWKTEREGDDTILIIEDSDAGGFAKPCRLWNDYIFEFETKIVRANSSWIIRASDILNYVMLQCSRIEINPHFRINGSWVILPPVKLPDELPLNEWFGVRITVSGTRVIVKVTLRGREITLLDQRLLESQLLPARITMPDGSTHNRPFVCSFPLGSVGFREYGKDECAHFRSVRVEKA